MRDGSLVRRLPDPLSNWSRKQSIVLLAFLRTLARVDAISPPIGYPCIEEANFGNAPEDRFYFLFLLINNISCFYFLFNLHQASNFIFGKIDKGYRVFAQGPLEFLIRFAKRIPQVVKVKRENGSDAEREREREL